MSKSSYRKQSSQIGSSAKQNVMSSLVWMTTICEGILMLGIYKQTEPWLKIALFCLAVGVIIFHMAMFLYFALNDPDRLQTENHNLALRQLTLQSLSMGDSQGNPLDASFLDQKSRTNAMNSEDEINMIPAAKSIVAAVEPPQPLPLSNKKIPD